MEIPCSDWVSPSTEGVGLGFPCRSFKEEEHSRLPVIKTQPTETHRSDFGLSPLANEAADECHISQKVLISNTARQTASEIKLPRPPLSSSWLVIPVTYAALIHVKAPHDNLFLTLNPYQDPKIP